ncbi:MAG: zinc-ribbon domain-containing protein [Clostridia bacterium]|nr:zinc-ribbon domain-containing protein [Clostridia bacterium]
MANCKKCGAELNGENKFCPSCGAPVEESSDFKKKVADLNNTEDTTTEFDPEDIEKNKIFAVLAYLSWLILIPIFVAKDSKFARYHANQGLVLAISATVGLVLLSLLPNIAIIRLVVSLFEIVVWVIDIIGLYNAATGRAKELPIIGKFRILNY